MTHAAQAEILSRGTSHDHGARHLRARMETLVNVEVSRRLKADDRRQENGHHETLAYLRSLKSGERPFDLDEVRQRVMGEARAQVAYRLFDIDYRDGAFVYRGVPGEALT